MIKIILLSTLLGTTAAWAQELDHTTKESNNDLRGHQPMLVIEDLDAEESVQLERNSTGDFYLVLKDGKELTKNKLARTVAEGLDERFSAAFVKVQFELDQDPKGCDADWRLVLRGDEYRFCSKNEQKDREIRPLFVEMRKAVAP